MEEVRKKKIKCELYNDSMQNWKGYPIQKAQLIIADIPFCIGANFYGSNPVWYNGGDNANGESKLAGKLAFYSDTEFNLYEFFSFCGRLLKKEPTKTVARGVSSDAPCMILFCSFEQQHTMITAANKFGFPHYIPLTFIKKSSPQALKANMRIVGATERALVFYRTYLPKFRNGARYDETGRAIRGTGHMVKDWFPFEYTEEDYKLMEEGNCGLPDWFTWERDGKEVPKIHPTQKPVKVIRKLIETFTDEGDVVIDCCFGSGTTARACLETNRQFYGFEIAKEYYNRARDEMVGPVLEEKLKQQEMEQIEMDAIPFC